MNNTRKKYYKLGNKLNVTGNNIKRIRVEQKMSLQRLSNKLMLTGLDICGQSIHDIEVGKRTVTDYELCIIAEVLNTSIEELLKEFSELVKEEREGLN